MDKLTEGRKPESTERRRSSAEPGAVTQLRNEIAHLPASEQLEAIRPAAPLQFFPDTDSHAVQFSLDAVQLMTGKEAEEAAEKLGYTKTNERSHGQPVFKKGRRYITPDVDSHIGGVWKMADSAKNLGSKKTRMGTYDANLNRIGD